MHYRHSFHAGNFADVFKHAVLCGLLSALGRKDKPWCYLETHAGAGAYDLAAEGAARTGEWREGIACLFAAGGAPDRDRVPWPLPALLDAVRALNPDGALRHYPGSPLFARACARPGDRLVLCERVPEVLVGLRENLRETAPAARAGGDRGRARGRVEIHHRDGYEAHALWPPAEKRGLMLVDPPFERPDEFEAVTGLLERALPRFAAGVHAIWYPLKDRHAAGRFERRVARLTAEPPLRLALQTGAAGDGRMHGCAVLVINPPYGFEADFAAAGAWLARTLARGPRAAYEARSLTGAAGAGHNGRP